MRDHIRDYATSAFRFYAENGKSAEKYKINLANEIIYNQQKLKSGINNPTETAVIKHESIIEDRMAEIKDMEAVERVMDILSKMSNGREIKKAIEYVYFDTEKIKKGSILERIHNAVIHIPASERSIFRWLKKARKLFAEERGLRL